MGGNALKQTSTRRYEAGEYRALRDFVIQTLGSHPTFADRRIREIPSYREKPSFGDLDLLVESDNLGPGVWEDLEAIFKPNEMFLNTPVCSLNVQELQVDLILTPSAEYDIALAYYAYNDLGNLMGRIADNLGFKLGHAGLGYIVRDETGDQLGAVSLTKDYRRAFAFLGYDAQRWELGFETLEDILAFAASSPLFNRKYYALEARNNRDRVRDRKRTTYTTFLKWLEHRENVPQHESMNLLADALERADEFFPGFIAEVEAIRMNDERQRIIKAKFNGDVVAGVTGLSGIPLSEWLAGFQKQWRARDEFELWVMTTGTLEVRQRLMSDFQNNTVVPYKKPTPVYTRENVSGWTGLEGRALSAFMTHFRKRWLLADNFYAWVETQNEEALANEVCAEQLKFSAGGASAP
jgi:hypothetical protein